MPKKIKDKKNLYLAQLIEKFMKKRKLSPKELSKNTQKSISTISLWKQGERQPTAITLLKIIKILKIPINDLLKILDS